MHFYKVAMMTREERIREGFFSRSRDMAELWPWQAEAEWLGPGIILCAWKRQRGASDARALEGDKGGTGISIIFR